MMKNEKQYLHNIFKEVIKGIQNKLVEERELKYIDGSIGITTLLSCPKKYFYKKKLEKYGIQDLKINNLEITLGYTFEFLFKSVCKEFFGKNFIDEFILYLPFKVKEKKVNINAIYGHLDSLIIDEKNKVILGVELKFPKKIFINLEKLDDTLLVNPSIVSIFTYTLLKYILYKNLSQILGKEKEYEFLNEYFGEGKLNIIIENLRKLLSQNELEIIKELIREFETFEKLYKDLSQKVLMFFASKELNTFLEKKVRDAIKIFLDMIYEGKFSYIDVLKKYKYLKDIVNNWKLYEIYEDLNIPEEKKEKFIELLSKLINSIELNIYEKIKNDLVIDFIVDTDNNKIYPFQKYIIQASIQKFIVEKLFIENNPAENFQKFEYWINYLKLIEDEEKDKSIFTKYLLLLFNISDDTNKLLELWEKIKETKEKEELEKFYNNLLSQNLIRNYKEYTIIQILFMIGKAELQYFDKYVWTIYKVDKINKEFIKSIISNFIKLENGKPTSLIECMYCQYKNFGICNYYQKNKEKIKTLKNIINSIINNKEDLNDLSNIEKEQIKNIYLEITDIIFPLYDLFKLYNQNQKNLDKGDEKNSENKKIKYGIFEINEIDTKDLIETIFSYASDENKNEYNNEIATDITEINNIIPKTDIELLKEIKKVENYLKQLKSELNKNNILFQVCNRKIY